MESSTDEIRRVSYRTQIEIEDDVDQSTDQHLGEQPEDHDPEKQIACCWLDKRLTTSDLLMGIPAMAVGIGSVWFGFQNPGGKAEDATTSIVVFSILGGIIFLMGLSIILLRIMAKSQGYEVTASGISEVSKRKSTTYLWSEINKVLISEFTASRMSDTDLTCIIEPVKGKRISLDSSYGGDPQQVIGCVLSSCDYIVRNPEGYSKNAK